jgi:Metallo-peptidase family M12B Reprolysin-like
LRGRSDEERVLNNDSGAIIDVLVVLTKEAECRNAGSVVGCTVTTSTEERMRGLIDLAVSETNTAFSLSGIFSSIRLVHAYRHPDYIEAALYGTTLQQLTFTTDGQMDDVHGRRALYGADIVHMITGAPGSCGIAWGGEPKRNTVFSISNYGCTAGYYSFGHEIGHSFGMLHDRGTEKFAKRTLLLTADTDPLMPDFVPF